MSVYHKPRFVGRHIDSDSRYEHFLNYMTNYELNTDTAPIYKQNFEAQIKNYLKQASGTTSNLIVIERRIAAMRKKQNHTTTGLIAQQDAADYTWDALVYSREAILQRIEIHVER
ncbi:MAG: hypothetical protein Q4A41_03815 [Bacillota bacterium]|nr:hypothetical protein [Bacillota bacterium]